MTMRASWCSLAPDGVDAFAREVNGWCAVTASRRDRHPVRYEQLVDTLDDAGSCVAIGIDDGRALHVLRALDLEEAVVVIVDDRETLSRVERGEHLTDCQ